MQPIKKLLATIKVFNPFRRKAQPPEPRRFRIPDEMAMEILGLMDEANKSLIGKRVFWERIHEMFPECATGSWTVSAADIMNIYVIERI